MPVALVLGANGQDGSYLAELLSARGGRVVGVDIHDTPGAHAPGAGYEYRRLDLADAAALESLLGGVRPDMIFHFGAIHGAAGFQYEPLWRKALEVNTASVHAVLEYARNSGKDPTLVYASSSKIFGDPLSGVIAEDSPRRMTCPYSITKLAAEGIIRHYRDRHKIKAGILNLFNHESPRRSSAFFFPKLARELNACLADGKHLFEVDTLDFFCDWGSAEEYMKLAVMAAEKAPGEDFIIATGATWLGRDFVNQMWRRFGLDASRHVRERRTIEGRPPFYRASLEKLSRRLGLTPKIGALDVCEAMAKHAGKQGFQ